MHSDVKHNDEFCSNFPLSSWLLSWAAAQIKKIQKSGTENRHFGGFEVYVRDY